MILYEKDREMWEMNMLLYYWKFVRNYYVIYIKKNFDELYYVIFNKYKVEGFLKWYDFI